MLFLTFYWHCPHSVQSRVYVIVWCQTICLSQHGPTATNLQPQQQSCCCRFAAVGPMGKGYINCCSSCRWWANAGSATLSAYTGSRTQTCYIRCIVKQQCIAQLLTTTHFVYSSSVLGEHKSTQTVVVNCHEDHTHTHNRLTAFCPGLPG